MIVCPWDKERVLQGTSCPRCGRDLSMLIQAHSLPQMYYNKALEEWSRNEHYKAIEALRAALAMAPGFVDAWVLQGKMLARTHRFREAVDSWQQALDLDPDNEDVKVLVKQTKASFIQTSFLSVPRVSAVAGVLVLLLAVWMVDRTADRRATSTTQQVILAVKEYEAKSTSRYSELQTALNRLTEDVGAMKTRDTESRILLNSIADTLDVTRKRLDRESVKADTMQRRLDDLDARITNPEALQNDTVN